jgi:hypothetical protein
MSWREPLPAACWDASTVSEVIPVEAEQRSDAVFMATHSRLPLLMRSRVDSAEGTLVTEVDLLQTVLDQPFDSPVIPILGRSGAGKSHLVRWLRINLETDRGTKKVFVPKHKTSLRGVIERILEHGHGEAFADLRQRVAQATASLEDEKEARLRLRTELATLIELHGSSSGTPARNREEQELRDYLADKDALPALLLDQWFRQHLLADGGAIARLVGEKLHGRGEEDREEAIGFEVGDFRISVDDMSRAGHAARDIASALTANPELPPLAAQMMNEQLEAAVSAVFGLGGDDLKNLLIELRSELDRQGNDLLVLVEDFSIFQGFQGGLIDAMTLIPSEQTRICGMKVVLALTTGYWTNQMPDTVKSRTYRVFDLDVPALQQTDFDAGGFVAPYLNAARLGVNRIEANARASEPSVPSACDVCPVVAECHDAFGEVGGIGLFPFNTFALGKGIKSKMGPGGTFLARDVLTRVVRPVLHRDHEAINEERFPSEAFAADFAAGGEGVLDIEEAARLKRTQDDSETNERRIRLVRFWSEEPGARNLHPVVHRAFAIPPVDSLARARPTAKPTPAPTPPTGKQEPVRAATPPLVDAVDRWIETGEIKQADKRDLRKIVHALLVAMLGFENGRWKSQWWTDHGNALPAFEEPGILLGDERPPPTKGLVLVRIARTEDDARAIRALAWAASAGSWREVRGGLSLQRLATARLRVWASSVEAGLAGASHDYLDRQVASLVSALLTGAQMLGIRASFGASLEDALASMVGTTEPDSSAPAPIQEMQDDVVTGRHQASMTRQNLRDWLFRLASFSQGGEPLALDVPRIAGALRRASLPPKVDDSQPEALQRYVAILNARIAQLDAIFAQFTEEVPDPADVGGRRIEASVEKVNGLLDHAAAVNRLPPTVDRAVIRQAGRDLVVDDIEKVSAFIKVIPRWEKLDVTRKLEVLTGDWYSSVTKLITWVRLAEAALSRLESLLTGPTGGTGALEEVWKRLDGALGRFGEVVQAFAATVDQEAP